MADNKPSAEIIAKWKSRVKDPSTDEKSKETFKNLLKKWGEDVEDVVKKVGEEVVGKKERKPRTTKPKSTKTSSADDVEKAKAEIKKKTGKTEEECETIIEQYRALRTKAQERKAKDEKASDDNKKRVDKLDKKGDIIEGTNEKTADAVIETAKVEVVEKIEKEIEKVEQKAEVEAKKEVEKEMPKESATEKKKAVAEKVEKKVKEKTKVVVKRVIVDTSAMIESIATKLAEFDKESQKEFLIKLRSDIDKLLTKFAFGGEVQSYNITQSNLSSSSVNMFAGGGGVEKPKEKWSDNTKKIIELISERRYYRLPPIEQRTMGVRAYQKILLDATKYAIKGLYQDNYDLYDIQKATKEAGGEYNKAFVDLYGNNLKFAGGGGVGSWSVWSDYGDNYENLSEKSAYALLDKLAKKYKLSDDDAHNKLYIQDMQKEYAGGGLIEMFSDNDDEDYVNDELDDIMSSYDVDEETIEEIIRDRSISDVDDLKRYFEDAYFTYANSDNELGERYVEMLGSVSELGNNTLETYFDYDAFGRDLAYDYVEYNGHYFNNSYARGGGVRKVNGKEYPFGSAWALEHNKVNKSQNYEVPMSKRKKMAQGGMSEHALEIGDEIIEDGAESGNENRIKVFNHRSKEAHLIDLDKGKRFAKGGSTSFKGRGANIDMAMSKRRGM
jgi:hypothetical protein